MAIQSIPETIPAQQARGTNSTSSLQVKDEENQHKAVTECPTEFWICFINFLTYVILISVILVDCVSLSLIQHGTAYTLGPILLTIYLLGMATYLTLHMTAYSTLVSPMANFTFALLIFCFIFTGLGLMKKYIPLPSCWNISNNDMEHCITTQESFIYGLKPASYSYYYRYNSFYDILATMNDRILSLEDTKEFLNKFDCDKNWFPTLANQHVSNFGSMGTSDSYPVTNLDCGPM